MLGQEGSLLPAAQPQVQAPRGKNELTCTSHSYALNGIGTRRIGLLHESLLHERLLSYVSWRSEACMALPGPAKGLAVATVTYINYPSRRKP